MSIETAVYEFIQNAVDRSAPAAAISGAIVHADAYQEISGGTKWIRTGDVIQSTPAGPVKEQNALLEIQFVARPDTQTLINRRIARDLANRMALEIYVLISDNERMGTTNGEICNVGKIIKRNEWVKVGTVRHAASFLRLQINPQS